MLKSSTKKMWKWQNIYILMLFHNITVLLLFDQIIAALLDIRDFF